MSSRAQAKQMMDYVICFTLLAVVAIAAMQGKSEEFLVEVRRHGNHADSRSMHVVSGRVVASTDWECQASIASPAR